MKVCVIACVVTVSCLMSRGAVAQSVFRTLTVEGAVDEAVQRNLGLLAERANLSIADAGVITARLRPNPVLSGGANSLDWLGTGFNEVNGAGPPEYSLRVDMPFERARKRELRSEVADDAKRMAEAQLAESVRRLKLDVTLAGIDVLEAKAKLQLAQDNLQALDRLLQLNERRLTSGAIAPVEVSRSRVAMLQYRGSVRTAELALTQARLKLLPLLGRKPDEPPIDIDDRLGLSPSPASPDLQALQDTAKTARPDLHAAQLEQARTQADLRLQVAQGKVDYVLGTEYRRQQGVNGKGNLLGLFFSVPLPVFNRNQGEIARAEAEGDKATRTATAVETNVAGEVASAYEAFDASRQLLIEIERDLLEPTAAARAGTTYMYQAGATSLLDVLDAQRAYNDTMETYYTAQAAYRRAQATLALVVGREMVQ
ncbi:MAG TPA: TolC family protein [Vicinamibacterales bacterium]|jgi:cobalt-zinc-cadmium efflux system outer membrane protein